MTCAPVPHAPVRCPGRQAPPFLHWTRTTCGVAARENSLLMRKTARISHFRAENRERRSKKINESSRLRANSLHPVIGLEMVVNDDPAAKALGQVAAFGR